jgi:methyl-accepting chemotaxis protein
MGGATGTSVDGTVDGDLVTAMLAEHGRWAYRLVRDVESAAPVPTESVLADGGCALGQWLNGDAVAALDPLVRSEVTDRHRRLHECAANLLTLAAGGEKERALAAVAPGGEFSLAANGLAVTVEGWRTTGSAGQAARAAAAVAPRAIGDELLGSVSLVRAEAAAAATATRDVADAIHELSDDVGQGLSTISEIAGAAGTTAHEADASRARSEDTHHRLAGLQQSVVRIAEALALIEQIARKTNIIVLNANIEAVRAGEAGKGFRVVAHEVKQLADGISTATREVKGVTEAARTDTDTILEDVTEFRTSIARIADNQSAIARVIDRHRSAAERMRDRLLTAAESIEVVEDNAASAAHGADSAVAVGSVVAERLRSMSSSSGHPTRRYQLRGARAWFLTPDLAHLVECPADGGSAAYYGVANGEPVGDLRPQHPTPPCGGGLFVSPDGRLVLVSWDRAGAFRLWDVGSAAAGASFQNTGTPLWVAVDEENWRLVAPTGRTAQVGRYRREVATIWDLRNGRAVEDVAVDDLAKAGEYRTHSVADTFATEAVTADQHLYAAARPDDGRAAFVLYDGRTGRERFRTADPDASGVRVAFAGELLLAHWESHAAGWVDVFDI